MKFKILYRHDNLIFCFVYLIICLQELVIGRIFVFKLIFFDMIIFKR